MDRDAFAVLFRECAAASRDFARQYVREELPDAIKFIVHLNASHDAAKPLPGEQRYAYDSRWERQRELIECGADTVVGALWRNGTLPQWVNLSVIGEDEESTLMEVLCCGRFTPDDERLYYRRHGKPSPFHILGPSFPVDYEEGKRFSIHYRSACWSQRSLDRLAKHAHEVWALAIRGDVCTDDALLALPVLSRMEILELTGYLRGKGLRDLIKQPRLRIVRARLLKAGLLDLADADALPALEELALDDLGDGSWGFSRIATLTPRLSTLRLSATGALRIDGAFSPHLQSLSLSAARLKGEVRLPPVLDSLSLHLRARDHSRARELLASVQRVRSLTLRGTPLTEEIVRDVVTRATPDYLDIVETGVSKHTAYALARENPNLRIFPRELPSRPNTG